MNKESYPKKGTKEKTDKTPQDLATLKKELEEAKKILKSI